MHDTVGRLGDVAAVLCKSTLYEDEFDGSLSPHILGSSSLCTLPLRSWDSTDSLVRLNIYRQILSVQSGGKHIRQDDSQQHLHRYWCILGSK